MDTWCLVSGAWGDTLACYGNIIEYLNKNKLNKSNIIYYGLDEKIINFLKIQKRIDKIKSLSISSPSLYFEYAGMAACDFPLWMKVTGLDQQIPNLVPTHISRYYNIENPKLCHRDFEINLFQKNKNTSIFCLKYNPYIVFQPFSCHSCRFDAHWPYWMEALNWILDNTDLNIVLIGQLTSDFDLRFKFPWIEHPKLINLVGQIDNMIEILHIVKNSKYIITTSNSLSMFSIVFKKPALVVCNQIIKEKANYYYNWIKYDPNVVLDFSISLDDFMQQYLKFSSV